MVGSPKSLEKYALQTTQRPILNVNFRACGKQDKQGQDNVMQFYDLADEYKDIDITIPMFYNDQYKNSNTAPYTQCRLIHFADGKMTLTGEEGTSTSKTQYPMFYSYFFVRDSAQAIEE